MVSVQWLARMVRNLVHSATSTLARSPRASAAGMVVLVIEVPQLVSTRVGWRNAASRVSWPAISSSGGGVGDQPAPTDDDQVIGELGHLAHQVAGDQHRPALAGCSAWPP